MGEFLVSLLIGGALGLSAGLILRPAALLGIVWNAVVGFLGSLLGRVAYGLVRADTDSITSAPLDLETGIVCTVGAALVLLVANSLRRRPAVHAPLRR